MKLKLILLILLISCTTEDMSLLSKKRLVSIIRDTGFKVETNFLFSVSNLDPNKVLIEKNDYGDYSLTAVHGVINAPNTEANFYRNMIKSVDNATSGTFEFIIGSMYSPLLIVNYVSFGLYIDNNNRIEFYRNTSSPYTINYRIVSGGSTVYSVNDVMREFGKIKIEVSATNVIQAFLFDGEQYNQIGSDYTASMGAKYIFAASCGGQINQLKLSGCSINSTSKTGWQNYIQNITATVIDKDTPGVDFTGATVSSNVSVINAALQTGNVIIDGNGGTILKDAPILIPSNRRLFFVNLKQRQSDAVYDNQWRNEDPDSGNNNIYIDGCGIATFDDNSANNYSLDFEIYGSLWDFPHSHPQELYKATVFCMCNTSNYYVKNLMFFDRKHETNFAQNNTYGLYEDIYMNTFNLTRNQGGLQAGYKTNNIVYKKIYGYTGDDFVSINTYTKRGNLYYPLADFVDENGYPVGDCYGVSYENLKSWGVYNLFEFIAGDGNKIYSISFKDIDVFRNIKMGYWWFTGYTVNPPAIDDVRDFTFDNVIVDYSYDANGVVHFNNNCKNITFINFQNNSGKPDYIVNGGTVENLVINGVQEIP